jgi:hypothetical protein
MPKDFYFFFIFSIIARDSTAMVVLDLNATIRVTEANERQVENKTNCGKVTFHLQSVTALFFFVLVS